MDVSKLFTPKSTIDIKVVTINNKKITNSILNQIPENKIIFDDLQICAEKIFGYVRSKDKNGEIIKWVIFQFNKKIYKDDISYLQLLVKNEPDNASEDHISRFMDIEDFLDEIEDHQIYI